MSPEDEIRVREIIADRPVATVAFRDGTPMSARQRRREAEIRSIVKQMLAEHDEATERRLKQAVVNAVMARYQAKESK